ncbi:hypothetical protein KDH_22120 [Dictyobacter sp. S3.2.2.5]|uniref:Uncharacterized protein n=1 Tax=Dictyobacter halimunensis TaxID=3026934 RepID=A0ABQ6FS86_9CHLR|nr:hypothetical protein KDH_22120 [Dictyobacter sp. S3.2.2.5]
MKRQVLFTFTIVIVLFVFGAYVYHDFPSIGIPMWMSAMVMLLCMSIQSIKTNAGEQKPVPDPYAGLATAGYIFGTVSFFFVNTIYLFSPPFAIVGLLLSLFGRKSFTHRIRASWGFGFSVIGVLAPIMVIVISMTLSHCSGWPLLNCSIPLGIEELFH